MNIQKTTAGGSGLLLGQIGAFWALFGDYTTVQIVEAVSNMSIQKLGVVVTTILFSIALMLYNENKEIPNEEG